MMKPLTSSFFFVVLFFVASAAVAADPRRLPTLTGTIAAVGDGEITLAGGLLRIDTIAAELPAGMSRDDLRVGDRVHVTLDPGLPLRAATIRVLTPPELQLYGTVDAVDPVAGTIEVFGVTYVVTHSTKLRRPTGQVASLSDFRAGSEVDLTARRTENGLVAEFVGLLQPLPPYRAPRETVIEGVVTAKDGSAWTIAGKRVLVTPRTYYAGGYPRIGDKVRASGIQGSGEVLAITLTKL